MTPGLCPWPADDRSRLTRQPGWSFAVAALALASAAARAAPAPPACPGDNAGLSLPPGFCATLFADHLGHARHLTIAADGTLYVNTWSGDYYTYGHVDKLPAGGFLVALRDTRGSGHADQLERFGDGVAQGSAGGTGIALYDQALYAEVNDRIVRYARPAGQFVPTGRGEVVVSGLPLTGDHPMHPFVIDSKGNLFVDVGTATNACDIANRMPNTKGHEPCTELKTRGGIWRFDAHKTGQRFSPAARYATGIRNGEGMDFDSAGRLFVTQHGRDQLLENYPKLYTVSRGHELPAEEVFVLEAGGDYGWPRCYYDGLQKKLVLAPEYGGDGGSKVGVCASKQGPAFYFPAHWAPNDLVIYKATQFPAAYQGGAFVAFHGSWNRAPAPQGGYNVAFQPLSDGHPAGDYIVFADGFAGPHKEPGRALARPCGLAVGPEGALYVSEDVHGKIWRITYSGPLQNVRLVAAAPAVFTASHEDELDLNALPLPPGATRAQVLLGARIFRGEVAGGTCSGCHGSDGQGSTVGPNLSAGQWVWGDGSWRSIAATINKGVVAPKHADGAMPPRGGAPLTDADVTAVAAYVWALSHAPKAAALAHPG
jgi:glucose/arabinose dehydrogenase/mono/diheme cytochrome c family protein